MEIGALKPVLTLLALPPASPLLVAAFGLLIALRAKRLGMLIALLGVASLWLLSCSAVAVWLASQLLPYYPPQSAATLEQSGAQAIVVLGGGIVADMPEFGVAQPNAFTLPRLRYGVWLARASGLPLAYSGGVGWGAREDEAPPPSEGEVVERVLLQDYAQPLRWVEKQARDTHENAQFLAPMLLADGVQRIALVTSYPHMPRSVLEFQRAGFDVIPAPTGYYSPWKGGWLGWLPSTGGLHTSWYVLRERLGLAVASVRGSSESQTALPAQPAAVPAALP